VVAESYVFRTPNGGEEGHLNSAPVSPPGAPAYLQAMRPFGRRSYYLIVSALALGLSVPSLASARGRVLAPPGNSGIGQYVEVVPTAGGGQPSNTVHSHGAAGGVPGGRNGGTGGSGGAGGSGGTGGSGGGAVSPATAKALAAHGNDGKAAASLAAATAPAIAHHGAGSSTGSSGGSGSAASPSGSSPTSSVLKALTGSSGGGLGPIIPVVLIASLLGAAGLALRRRRAT
jgi:hypothetical protein